MSTYQQLKELSPIANDEVPGAARRSGVPREGRSVGKRNKGRLVPVLHEEFPDFPRFAQKTTFKLYGQGARKCEVVPEFIGVWMTWQDGYHQGPSYESSTVQTHATKGSVESGNVPCAVTTFEINLKVIVINSRALLAEWHFLLMLCSPSSKHKP